MKTKVTFRKHRHATLAASMGVLILHSVIIGGMSGEPSEERSAQCSEILCKYKSKDKTTNCSTAMDECACQRYGKQDMLMKCQGLMQVNITYMQKESVLLNCKDRDTDFQQVTSYMATYLQFIDDRFYRFGVRCGQCSENSNRDSKNRSNTPETYMTLNLSRIACYQAMSALDLSNNCVGKIEGRFGGLNTCDLLTTFDLSNNFLSSMPNSSFDPANSLLFLDLSFNSFKELNGNNFENLNYLTNLDLSVNEIVTITDETFEYLPNLISLNLSSNSISSLQRRSFAGLSLLEKLDLSRNDINALPEHIFNELSSLTLLSLHHNDISFLPDTLIDHNINLRYFSLSFNQMLTIPSKLFQNTPNLTMFLANNNKLEAIPNDLFKNTHQLYAVSLENNNLNFLPFGLLEVASKNLIVLDLSSNHFTDLPRLRGPNDKNAVLGEVSIRLVNNSVTALKLPLTDTVNASVRELDLSDNCITSLTGSAGFPRIYSFSCVNCCMSTIEPKLVSNVILSANFSLNKIVKVDMTLLKSVAHLLEVDLSHNNIRSVDISWDYPITISDEEEFEIKETHVKRKIILNHNPVVCDCRLIPFLRLVSGMLEFQSNGTKSGISFTIDELLCSDPPTLRGISVLELIQETSLSDQLRCNISVNLCPNGCHCYYTIFSPETVINCSNHIEQKFPDLSKVDHPILLDLSNTDLRNLPPSNSGEWNYFKELHLHNNALYSMENINVTPTLTRIHLHDNNFTDFTLPKLVDAFTNNVTITLAGNPWVCNCDLLKIRDLATYTSVPDIDDISCVTGNGIPILIANLTLDYCKEVALGSGVNKGIVIPIFGALGCALVAAAILLYWKRSRVQKCCNKCMGVAELNDVNKLYDVYVCSSGVDSEWVYLNIVALFQTEQVSYRLCFHDTEHSELSEIAITDSMKQSQRIMVILTGSFVDNGLSSLHLEKAFQQSVKDHVARLIIVVPDELPDITKLSPKLAAFLRHNTCIYWKKENFEGKLLFCLPKTRSNPRSTQREEIELAAQA